MTLVEARSQIADAPASAVRRVRLRTWTLTDAALIAASAISGLSFTWLLFQLTPLQGAFGFVVCGYVSFAFVYWLVIRDVEGPLHATDKLTTVLIGGAAVTVIIPLGVIVVFVTAKGLKALRPEFFTSTLASVGAIEARTGGGGALHALVGTLQQITIAFLVSVPLALMVAIFLNEVGGRFVRPVRFVVDAMSGVPSIVAGLFIYAVWILPAGGFSGFGAGLALSVLMLPTVIRTSEEMLRIVPDGLREASLALGAPEWRTVLGVVLPTARAGLVTAAILGVARAVGETAPLIMTSFGSSLLNLNPFDGPQSSLPIFIYRLISSPEDSQKDLAWTGALLLITTVLVLFTLARLLGRGGSIRLRKGARA
jgi:phosphate transport system permease protein